MRTNLLLPYGLRLYPCDGTFPHEFLTELQHFIEALPGAVTAEVDSQAGKAWWLYGSALKRDEACHHPHLSHLSLVAITEDEFALQFCTTTFEEHEARMIQWVLERCACTIYDSDYGTELKTSDDLARWMHAYGVRNTNLQQRAMTTFTEELTSAYCHAIHYSADEEFSLLLSTSHHGQRRFVIPQATIVIDETGLAPHLTRIQSIGLRMLEVCGSSVSSVLFTPDRVLHIVFDDTTQLTIDSKRPGDYQYAWALESPASNQSQGWVERVWVPRGGDIVLTDPVLPLERTTRPSEETMTCSSSDGAVVS